MEEFGIFVFDAYDINVCVKFDDFFLIARERKSLSMYQLSKKFTAWNASNVSFYITQQKPLFLVTSSKIEIHCVAIVELFPLAMFKTLRALFDAHQAEWHSESLLGLRPRGSKIKTSLYVCCQVTNPSGGSKFVLGIRLRGFVVGSLVCTSW